jgi:arsenate reductase
MLCDDIKGRCDVSFAYPSSCDGFGCAGDHILNPVDSILYVQKAKENTKICKAIERDEGSGMTKSITIYGIKACDTMKKARTWLDTQGVNHAFHDYKAQGVGREVLEAWVRLVGWEKLLNRTGTTFRKLPDTDKAALDEAKAISLMLAHPSLIKRPVLDIGGALIVGFRPEIYATALR